MNPARGTPVEPVVVGYEAAKTRSGLGQSTLETLVRDGTLRSAKVGKRRLIFLDSIDALIRRCSEPAA